MQVGHVSRPIDSGSGSAADVALLVLVIVDTAVGPCCVVLCTCVCHRCGARGYRSCRRCRGDVALNVSHLERRQWPISVRLDVLVLRLHLLSASARRTPNLISTACKAEFPVK